MRSPSRRRFVASLAATAGLAGCLDSGGSASSPAGTEGSSPTRTGPASPDSSPPTASQSGDPSMPTPSETPTSNDPATSDDPPTSEPPTTEPPASDVPSADPAWQTAFEDAVTTAPVVADGTVFVGTDGGTVSAFDASGRDEWPVELAGPVQELAVHDGSVLAVVGTPELASDHVLRALDADSGDERWRFSPGNWWLNVLATSEGTVYVATEDDAIGDSGETLYAVPIADGDSAWSAEIGHPREATVTDDAVYVSSTGSVDAFDRANGDHLWDRSVTNETLSTLGATDGTVVYAYRSMDRDPDSALVAVDAESGADLWRHEEWAVNSTIADDGDLFAGGERTASLDPADGTVRWDDDVPSLLRAGGLEGDRLYAGSDSVRSYSRTSGERRWTWSPDPPQGGTFPVGFADGTVFLDSYHDAAIRNRYKFALDAASGDGRWAFEAGTELTDLAVGAGIAVTGGEDGTLYALE